MKHQFLVGLMLAASLIACQQKKTTNNFDSRANAPIVQSLIPESPDTMLSNGRRNIFLVGRKELEGFFVERSVFPVGYRSYPHTHPVSVYVTVIGGTFNIAFTSDPDSAAVAKAYGAGSFVIIPADAPHFEWFTERTEIDIAGIGPVKTNNLAIIHSSK